MPNDVAQDSRNFQSYFWVRADIDTVTLIDKKRKISLHSVLDAHPAFDAGAKSRPYFDSEKYVSPDQWHIPFWSQEKPRSGDNSFPRQPIYTQEQLELLAKEVALGWEGMSSLAFNGAALTFTHSHVLSKLALTFNDVGQRIYDGFTSEMTPHLDASGFVSDPNRQVSPLILLARRHDGKRKNIARDNFSKAMSHHFKKIKTEAIGVKSFIIGQGFFSVTGHCKARRDLAKVNSNGSIEWLHDGDPFDVEANGELINRGIRHLKAA